MYSEPNAASAGKTAAAGRLGPSNAVAMAPLSSDTTANMPMMA